VGECPGIGRSEVLVSEITDTVNAERFAEIMELKKDCHDVRDQIDRAKIRGEIQEPQGLRIYQRKVRDYIMSVETVLDPAVGDPSPFWSDYYVGDFILPDERQIRINGLQEFLALPETYSIDIEREYQKSYRHAKETIVETKEVRPPERVIERAFRNTNKALDAAGFDIQQPDDTPTSKFKRIEDVEAVTQIVDYLNHADEPELREFHRIIGRTLEEGADKLLIDEVEPRTNGHADEDHE
jgi:hypothetical protein